MLKFKRKKKFNLVNSFFFWFDKILPAKNIFKLKIYLNLLFVFKRLAHEKSYLLFKDSHPATKYTIKNLKHFVKKNYRILDIGCGNGYISNYLSAYCKEIICIDHNPLSIDIAKLYIKRKNITFICGDVFEINKKTNVGKIDLIVCSHIIEHLSNPFFFLKKLKKLNSHIYIEVPDFENEILNLVKKKIKYYLSYTDIDHIYEFDRKYLIGKLKKLNYKIIEQNYQNGVMSLLIK
jgi:SAM-dependent methyltransferase